MKTKNLSTSFKIIKILKLMTEKPVSVKEIMSSLEENEGLVCKETISKYFATLRNAGCNIQKRQNKFYIKYPVLNLADTELDTLAAFQKTAKNLCSKKDYEDFLRFLDKLFILADEGEISRYKNILQNNKHANLLDTGKFKEKIETLSEFMKDTPQKIKIDFDKKAYEIVPLKFHYFKKSIYLFGYDCKNKVNKNFPLDKIQDIKRTPSNLYTVDFSLSTTFKIKGELKNSYSAKEGEIISPYEDYLIVVNKKEDKEELFKRLLKYGTNCEVLYPKTDREKFKTLINNLISKIK